MKTYEKNIEATVTVFRHTVRILIGSDRKEIEDALKNVPQNAAVVMFVDNDDVEHGLYGKIIFEEEVRRIPQWTEAILETS